MAALGTDVFVCVLSFASADGTAIRGEPYRADHPLVVAAPRYFMPFGTPPDEWPSDFDLSVQLNEERAREEAEGRVRAARANRVTISAPATYKAKRDLLDVPGSHHLEGINDPRW